MTRPMACAQRKRTGSWHCSAVGPIKTPDDRAPLRPGRFPDMNRTRQCHQEHAKSNMRPISPGASCRRGRKSCFASPFREACEEQGLYGDGGIRSIAFHALTRSATGDLHPCSPGLSFQSTHSRGVRPAAVAGRPRVRGVSIHALARSATLYSQPYLATILSFQSTHSRGVRRR